MSMGVRAIRAAQLAGTGLREVIPEGHPGSEQCNLLLG
jgi:hypothetical protein